MSAESTSSASKPRLIRLLRLTPLAPGSDVDHTNDMASFSLVTFEFDKTPEYIALSYTWNNPVISDAEYSNPWFVDPSEDPWVEVKLGGGSGPEVSDGNDAPKAVQIAKGRQYTVPKNLKDCLIQLARSEHGNSWLWADALCIDQNNLSEKAAYVAIMDEIYSNAYRVIVWLGLDTTGFSKFSFMHEEFLGALTTYTEQYGLESLKRAYPYDPKFTEKLTVGAPEGGWHKAWEGFYRFCRRRRWFSRAWIVQEVLLAREIVLCCGPHTVPWSKVEDFSRLLWLTGWSTVIGPSGEYALETRAWGDDTVRLHVLKEKFKRIMSYWDETKDLTATEQRLEWHLFCILYLWQTRVYFSSDPRDKIYANLGILKEILPGGMEMPFVPDYSPNLNSTSVFTAITSKLLQEVPRLCNLSYVENYGSKGIWDLPSWVPDYTCNFAGAPFDTFRDPDCDFNCYPFEETHCTVQDDSLHVKGLPFDNVTRVCLPFNEIIKTQEVRCCIKAIAHLSARYEEDPGEVLWRTILANTLSGRPVPGSMVASFKDWINLRLCFTLAPELVRTYDGGWQMPSDVDEPKIRSELEFLSELHRNAGSTKLSLPTVDEVLLKCHEARRGSLELFVAQNSADDTEDTQADLEAIMARVEGKASQFQAALNRPVPFRRLYVTSQGYMGIGPESTEVGDKVWMLQGAKVPFVLRSRSDNSYTLIGETYLHGFMAGEMYGKLGDQLEEIIIR